MEVRCPAHDVVFQTETDHKKPGSKDLSRAPGKEDLHPRDDRGISCHPDCPIGQKLARDGAGKQVAGQQTARRDFRAGVTRPIGG